MLRCRGRTETLSLNCNLNTGKKRLSIALEVSWSMVCQLNVGWIPA